MYFPPKPFPNGSRHCHDVWEIFFCMKLIVSLNVIFIMPNYYWERVVKVYYVIEEILDYIFRQVCCCPEAFDGIHHFVGMMVVVFCNSVEVNISDHNLALYPYHLGGKSGYFDLITKSLFQDI